MSIRPVYIPKATKPYYQAVPVEFDWQAGQAAIQKQKNSRLLRESFQTKYPEYKVLEVSTKSDTPEGQNLSPFHLSKRLDSLKKSFPVENIFQASKVFSHGGPYYDLLGAKPADAKRDERLNNSGSLVHYRLEGQEYPKDPDILFYNWLYIQALRENPSLAKVIRDYDAFTDIEFNPEKGKNNQARACAIYHSLEKQGLLKQTDSFEDFKKLFLEQDITQIEQQKKPAAAQPTLDTMRKVPTRRKAFAVGQWLEHPGIGKGEVIRKTKDAYLINFRVAGPRTISREFVETQCRPALR